VMLYELLTSRHPFGPLSPDLTIDKAQVILRTRQNRGPEPVRQFNAKVSPAFANTVERCLAFDRQERPQSAAELAHELRGASAVEPRLWRSIGRSRGLIAVAVGLVFVLAWATAAGLRQREINYADIWRLGQQAYQGRGYAEAVKHFSVVLAADPDRIEVVVARARAYLKLGESDKSYFNQAFADFQRAEAVQPSGEISAGYSYCLFRLNGIREQAREKIAEAIERGYAPAEAHNNLAFFMLQNKGEFAKAVEHLEKSIALKPNLQAAYHNLGMLRFIQATIAGAHKPPAKQINVSATQGQRQQEFRAWFLLGKADFRKALECGPASAELYRDAACLWALSTSYEPADIDDALKYLACAVSQGCVPNDLANNVSFHALVQDPRFQALCDLHKPSQPLLPTLRVVDPLPD
jgi:tetratricopeptide (TPR) repeat protein